MLMFKIQYQIKQPDTNHYKTADNVRVYFGQNRIDNRRCFGFEDEDSEEYEQKDRNHTQYIGE